MTPRQARVVRLYIAVIIAGATRLARLMGERKVGNR